MSRIRKEINKNRSKVERTLYGLISSFFAVYRLPHSKQQWLNRFFQKIRYIGELDRNDETDIGIGHQKKRNK